MIWPARAVRLDMGHVPSGFATGRGEPDGQGLAPTLAACSHRPAQPLLNGLTIGFIPL